MVRAQPGTVGEKQKEGGKIEKLWKGRQIPYVPSCTLCTLCTYVPSGSAGGRQGTGWNYTVVGLVSRYYDGYMFIFYFFSFFVNTSIIKGGKTPIQYRQQNGIILHPLSGAGGQGGNKGTKGTRGNIGNTRNIGNPEGKKKLTKNRQA